MNTHTAAPLKIVQWATGNIGTRSLQAIIEHPRMELVGLYVHSASKAGKDAGELCGMAPTGVIATNDIEKIIGLQADCVLYMQQGCDVDDVCRLLESGANVVTTRVEFHHPRALDTTVRERIEAACQCGGSSLYSTGSSPGFITEVMPLGLLSLQRRLDCLTIDEYANMSSRNSPEMIFQLMGFGQPMGEYGEQRLAHVREGFAFSLGQIADAIAMPLDSFDVKGEFAAASKTVEIAAGVIEQGKVGAQRISIVGMRAGRPLLQMRLNWYCTTEIEADWDLRETGWRLLVEGDTPLDVCITFPVSEAAMAATTPGYTAHRAVNAVAAVCAAAPGIRTTVDLPQIIPELG